MLGYHKAQILSPKLILLDSSLPKPSSIPLIRMLQGLPMTSSIPIFLLTSRPSSEECINALKAGAVDYIPMPYIVEELIERMRIHVRLAHERSAVSARAESPCQAAGEGKLDENCRPADLMLVRVAKEVINEQLTNPPTQKLLAEMFGVSQRKLVRAFKNCLGVKVNEYIRQQRMQKAQYYLVNTTLSLSDISDELGFSSPANFATAFRVHTGLTPRQYRNHAMTSGGT